MTLEWRKAHEMESAGFGFVWPRVLFASDGEAMQIWAVAARSRSKNRKAVHYLTGTGGPVSVPLTDFTQGVDDLLAATVWRLKVRTRLYGDSTLGCCGMICAGIGRIPGMRNGAAARRSSDSLSVSAPMASWRKLWPFRMSWVRRSRSCCQSMARPPGLPAFVPLEALSGTPGIAGPGLYDQMKDRPAKEAWPLGWVSSGVRRSVSVRSSVHGRPEGWGMRSRRRPDGNGRPACNLWDVFGV